MNAITDEDILKDIIERLREGVLPWRRPWSDSSNVVLIGSVKYSALMWPSNLRAPRVPFGLLNGTKLLAHASTQRYRSNLWITKSVVKELKAELNEEDNQPVAIRRYLDENSRHLSSKAAVRHVYNVDQVIDCERKLGLTFLKNQPSIPTTKYERCEKLRDELVHYHNLRIVYENRAAYSPSWDTVVMPDIDQFNVPFPGDHQVQDGAAHYWATLWHEVVHWTGHPSRLDRRQHRQWGDNIYAFEELIAELGATFLCAHLGIEGELQHESYLDSWSQALEQDPAQSLWSAAAYAEAAKKFILTAPERRQAFPHRSSPDDFLESSQIDLPTPDEYPT